MIYLSSELARWRMRVWRLSAALCGQRAAGAENNVYRPSSLWRLYIQWNVLFRGISTIGYSRINVLTPKVPPLSLALGKALPRRSQASSSEWYRQSEEPPPQQAGHIHLTPPPCRSLHNRRGLWPASNKPSANAAPSASSSRLAPTPPPQHRCSTLRCRLATQHPPRASAPVRLLSRTVSV